MNSYHEFLKAMTLAFCVLTNRINCINYNCVQEEKDGIMILQCESKGLPKIAAATEENINIRTFLVLKANFTNNNIQEIRANHLGNYGRLLELRLNKNKIFRIDREAFQKCSKLYFIDLSENQILKIEDGTFQNLPLKNLILDHNQISAIEIKTFEGVTVETISMKYNQVIYIDRNALFSTSAPLEIDLSYNLLERIQKRIFRNLNNSLMVLILTGNKIKNIANICQSQLYTLRRLYMNGMGLSEMPNCLFGIFPNLIRIELADNKIRYLHNEAFTKNHEIKVIVLKNNKHLHRISRYAFQNLTTLMKVDLTNVPIDCLSWNNIPKEDREKLENVNCVQYSSTSASTRSLELTTTTTTIATPKLAKTTTGGGKRKSDTAHTDVSILIVTKNTENINSDRLITMIMIGSFVFFVGVLAAIYMFYFKKRARDKSNGDNNPDVLNRHINSARGGKRSDNIAGQNHHKIKGIKHRSDRTKTENVPSVKLTKNVANKDPHHRSRSSLQEKSLCKKKSIRAKSTSEDPHPQKQGHK